MSYIKLWIARLLKKADKNSFVYGAGVTVLVVFLAVGLVKISVNGGLAKAKKEMEIAREIAMESSVVTTMPNATKADKKVETTLAENTTEVTSGDTTAAETTTGPVVETTMSEERANKIKDYYGNSVFIGDSVMYGLSTIVGRGGTSLGTPHFLAVGSFSVYHALNDQTGSATLPLYKGAHLRIEDSLSQMEGIDKAFIFFGLNDMNMYGSSESVYEHYIEFIDNIKKAKGSIKINIISTTYVLSGNETGALTTANIVKLNNMLKEYCIKNQYGYVDIANKLGDPSIGLFQKYCSDGYVHHNLEGYKVWIKTLEEFVPD